MRNRRRWLWGPIAAIPIVGIIVAYSAPPFDEYALFDRIGTPATVIDSDAAPFNFVSQTGAQSFQKRRWNLTLPEPDAKRTVEQFASPAHGWQQTGSGSGYSWLENHQIASVSTLYTNNDTGDRLEFSTETDKSGTTKTVRQSVIVTQEKSGAQWWKRLKRWEKLTFSR